MRSTLVAVVVGLLGYVGVLSAESIALPPGRVVDAVADTNDLSIDTVAFVQEAGAGIPAESARDRGEAALASYSYDWEAGLPGWEISFHPGRKGVLGYTFVQERKIEVYVRPEMSNPLLAHVIAHEIGHAIDVSKNSSDDRRRWQELRGISDEPWWPGSGATDFSTGAGDFAESFAAWQVGTGSFRSNLGTPPDSAANRLMAELAN